MLLSSRICLLLQDPPEYYNRPGGYLVYDSDVPAGMLSAAVPASLAAGGRLDLNGTLGHFELVHHQLKQVTCAKVLSSLLSSASVFGGRRGMRAAA